MSHVFVSYVQENSAQAKRLKEDLGNLKVPVWIDRDDINPGEHWKSAIRKAINRGSHFIALFSKEYSRRDRTYMNTELAIAIEELKQRPADRAWFIPVLLSPCEVPDLDIGIGETLRDLQWVSLYEDWDAGVQRILQTIGETTVSFNPVIVVGSGNGDLLLTHRDPIQLGAKNFVDPQQFLGGGGLNASRRLLAAGHDVAPILSLGRDHLGETIKNALLETATVSGVSPRVLELLSRESFFAPGITTPQSTIIMAGNQRTILAQRLSTQKPYLERIEARLDEVEALLGMNDTIGAILIGHIHTDAGGGRGANSTPGLSTKYLISRYAERCGVFLNLGRSQIELGAAFWEKELERARIVQTNQREAMRLFGLDAPFTPHVVKWFREREISCIVTFGRLGAVASFGAGKDGVIYGCPLLDEGEVVDMTGAGDAFMAGAISVLAGQSNVTFDDFRSSVEVGRLWGAYACQTLGASNNPPSGESLRIFKSEYEEPRTSRAIDILQEDEAWRRLEKIDEEFLGPQ